MTFEDVWNSTPTGGYVAVSDGSTQPPAGGMRWFMWRSHNFVGRLVERDASSPRGLVFELQPQGGATVRYTIAENVDHTFELSDEDGYLAG
jgi:hypothetical protein